MATSNISTTKTGTGWTVDVTAANLLTDTDIKDFIVLHNGITASLSDYTKTSPTLLTYNGAALASNTPIEIRRKTPNSIIQSVQFGDRFSSSLWNNELDRMIRWREEADLNGVGASSLVSVALPKDDAYGVVWNGDVIFPPTRNAVYDKLELMTTDINTKAPIASPTFTGDPKAPTPATGDNDTSIATTEFVKNQGYATIASPVFSGNPQAPTPATADNDTSIATTAFVKDNLLSYAPLASPVFTGNPTAPTPALNDNDTSIATTAYAIAQIASSFGSGNARARFYNGLISSIASSASATLYSGFGARNSAIVITNCTNTGAGAGNYHYSAEVWFLSYLEGGIIVENLVTQGGWASGASSRNGNATLSGSNIIYTASIRPITGLYYCVFVFQ